MDSPGLRAPGIPIGPPRWEGIVAVGVLAVVVAAALGAYREQVTTGLAVTGLNSPGYWGLYVVNFVFFIGLSAGGIIVASLVHAFGLREFRSIARIAELMAISCLVLAMTFILLDLGRPDRMLFLIRHWRIQSPLIWDVAVVHTYLVISLTYGYFGTRADLVRAAETFPRRRRLYHLLALGYLDLSPRALARDDRILRVLALVGLVGAIALHTVTAWILGLVKARPGWYGAIMAPLFIVSATVSGVALLLVSVVFCRRVLGLPIEARVIRSLGKLLALVIPVLGYFLFAELLTVLYAKEPAALRVFDEMMFGRYAPVFWGNLILGLMAPLAILVVTLLDLSRRLVAAGAGTAVAIVMLAAATGNLPVPRPVLGTIIVAGVLLALLRYVSPETRIGAAAALVVLGVLAERWNIVVPPLIGFSHLPYPPGHYAPTGTELLLVAGVYAVGGILFAFAARILPLVESE